MTNIKPHFVQLNIQNVICLQQLIVLIIDRKLPIARMTHQKCMAYWMGYLVWQMAKIICQSDQKAFNKQLSLVNTFCWKLNALVICLRILFRQKASLFPIFQFCLTLFAEMNKEEILCIVRTVNETNCANDQFNIRKMTSGLISQPITTLFTVIVNSSFSIIVFPDSEKYAVVKPFLKPGKDGDELSSYRPSYNTSFLSKVLLTACPKQLNEHLSKMPALQKL